MGATIAAAAQAAPRMRSGASAARLLALLLLTAIPRAAWSCTNYMVTAGASDDGSTHVAYNSDG